jgi:hypothetical protein
MVNQRKTLQEMLSDASLLGQLGKERGIDYNKQLDEIIGDMTLAIPSNTFSDSDDSGHSSSIFDDGIFKDLIDATYHSEKDRKDLLSNLTGQSNTKKKEIFNQYLNDLSKEVEKPIDDLIKSFLSDMIYDPSRFCNYLAPLLPRNLIKDVQFKGELGDFGHSHVDFNVDNSAMVQIQNKLLGELIRKNSKYRKFSLLLDEDLLMAPSFSQMVPSIYHNDQDVLIAEPDKIDRMQQSRFRFSLLTAHVGVYHKKQRGKLRYVVENILNIPLDGSAKCSSAKMMNVLGSIKKDLDSSRDVPNGVQAEFRLKLMQGYAGLQSRLEESESTIDKLKHQAQKTTKLECDYNTAISQITELSDKISLLEAQQKTLASTVADNLTQDYECRLQELESYKSKVKKLSYQLNYFRGKCAELDLDVEIGKEELEKSQSYLKKSKTKITELEHDLIISQNDPTFDVDINAAIDVTGEYKPMYERAVALLSREPDYGRRVQIGSKAGMLHTTLAKHFGAYEFKGYRIINVQDAHRVICSRNTLKKSDPVILLILPHDEYDKWCDGKK